MTVLNLTCLCVFTVPTEAKEGALAKREHQITVDNKTVTIFLETSKTPGEGGRGASNSPLTEPLKEPRLAQKHPQEDAAHSTRGAHVSNVSSKDMAGRALATCLHHNAKTATCAWGLATWWALIRHWDTEGGLKVQTPWCHVGNIGDRKLYRKTMRE